MWSFGPNASWMTMTPGREPPPAGGGREGAVGETPPGAAPWGATPRPGAGGGWGAGEKRPGGPAGRGPPGPGGWVTAREPATPCLLRCSVARTPGRGDATAAPAPCASLAPDPFVDPGTTW